MSAYCDVCDDQCISGDNGTVCGICHSHQLHGAQAEAETAVRAVLGALGKPAECKHCEVEVWFVHRWGSGRPGRASSGKGQWWVFDLSGTRHDCKS